MTKAPDHLAVYLSNRCNLDCKYCYVAVNKGEPAKLSFEHIKANLDYFFEKVQSDNKKVTFLGGEPFLNFPLLQQAVDYVRQKAGDGVILQTFTNGVNISQDKLDWLNSRGVFVTVSLDGMKESNDRNRVFFKDTKGSVYDAVIERLRNVRKEGLGVSLVFDSTTVTQLLANIEHFRAMGFSRITFNPELYEIWSPEKLEVLRTVMRGFRRYYGALLKTGNAFTVPILFSVLEKQELGQDWWHECHNVVLGSDNKFYSCDKALTFEFEKIPGAETGSAEKGMDWDRRGSELGAARAVVERVVPGKTQYFCPMGVVFYSGYAKSDPDALLRNFTTVSGIFGEELQAMIDENAHLPAYHKLYRDVARV